MKHGPIILALVRAARPRENAAVRHHTMRLIEELEAAGDSPEPVRHLKRLLEPPREEERFIPMAPR